ncbi:MAG: phenylalanine--tRNA ligase subunit beta [Brevinematia bacterium]
MKFPLSWLNDFIDLEKILKLENNNINKLADKLTKVGIEVEEIVPKWMYNGKVVVGYVVTISDHPTKNSLLVCEVDVRNGEDKIVITADKTVKKGDKVAYCYPGTILEEEHFFVDEKEFENITSQGMLASLQELGIEDKSETVWKINSDWQVGTEVKDNILPPFLKEDYVLSVKVPSNRADVLSVLGIARELSAIYNLPLKYFQLPKFQEESLKPDIKIKDDRCFRYCSRIIEGVKVCESKDIIKIRLLLSGQRPINNIVDVTNYVMLAIGQPMHAFDYDKLKGKKIIVRSSQEGEKILALDGSEVKLPEGTLVISDLEKPVAIAGIIGGEETGITENTNSILLESAYFDYNTIRKTSREIGITTESSLRFSRDIGSYTTEMAINLATSMIEGKVSQLTDVKNDKAIYTLKENFIKTSFSDLANRIGFKIPEETIKNILTLLGFEVQVKGEEMLIKVPLFRRDISIVEDIVEEITRIYGYDNIPSTLPRIDRNPMIPSNLLRLEQIIRNNLISQGLTEVMNFSFISVKDLDIFKLSREEVVEILNPMNSDETILKPYLFINLLKTVKHNLNNGFKNLALFEIGKTFKKIGGEFEEIKSLSIVLHGKKYENWYENSEYDFFDLKDILEKLSIYLKLEIKVEPLERIENYPFLHTYIAGEVLLEGKNVGVIGKVHPEITKKLEIGDVVMAELKVDLIDSILSSREIKFENINRLPVSSKNISVLVPENCYVGTIEQFVRSYDTLDENLKIVDVRVVDIYKGPNIPEGFKSVNLLMKFQWIHRVEGEDKIKVLFNSIIESIKEEFNFVVRGV